MPIDLYLTCIYIISSQTHLVMFSFRKCLVARESCSPTSSPVAHCHPNRSLIKTVSSELLSFDSFSYSP